MLVKLGQIREQYKNIERLSKSLSLRDQALLLGAVNELVRFTSDYAQMGGGMPQLTQDTASPHVLGVQPPPPYDQKEF